MTHLSIVIPRGGAVLNSIVKIFKIFNWVNVYSAEKGGGLLFDIHLFGLSEQESLYGGLYSVAPDILISQTIETDLVILPILAGNIDEVKKNNIDFIPWLRKQYFKSAEIYGLCTSAFLLADTYLIDDEQCLVHWNVAPGFRKEFSQIQLAAEKIMGSETIFRDGAYSFINGILTRLAGMEVAAACSNIFEIEFNQECQSVVALLKGQKEKENGILNKTGKQIQNRHKEPTTEQKFVEMFSQNISAPLGSASLKEDSRSNSKSIRELLKRNTRL